MAFTDNCDLYAAVHEDGINLIARHILRQRPSLFNYERPTSRRTLRWLARR